MANQIDTGLYNEALTQVVAKLARESNPVSALASQAVASMRQETAASMFTNALNAATQVQEGHKRHVAGRTPADTLPTLKPIAGLPPEMQARREESRRKMAEMFTTHNNDIHAAFDESHERTMTTFFTRLGISPATTEKVVVAIKENVSRG